MIAGRRGAAGDLVAASAGIMGWVGAVVSRPGRGGADSEIGGIMREMIGGTALIMALGPMPMPTSITTDPEPQGAVSPAGTM
jgi:hypothetical protein